ncbi:MAG: hypothetical protein IJT24_04210 [Lachnospiraceae bacterium]|nr:hypothetical protein [Lachnospiraceae bacterium]
MTTEQVFVKNDGEGLDKALRVAENFAKETKLTGRNAMHLRLITEELLGMVRAIAGEFTALFWLDGDDKECSLHLMADVDMDPDKRRELIAASTSKKNEAAKGIMGKIRELVEVGMENYDEVGKLQVKYGVDPLCYGTMGIDNETMSQAMLSWSLNQYRNSLSEAGSGEGYYEAAWDELEKSVVANVADDVRVGIRNDKVQITIYKKFSGKA